MSVLETNVVPTIQAFQNIFVTELAAVNTAIAGNASAADLNNVVPPATGVYAGPLSFLLLTGDAAAAAPACALPTGVLPAAPASGTPMLSLSPSGALTWVGVNTSVVNPWQYMAYYAYGGFFSRAAFGACVNVSDSFGGVSTGLVTVVVLANIPAVPQILNVDVPAGGALLTEGRAVCLLLSHLFPVSLNAQAPC